MANISFKSITFPGLANKYQVPEISNDLMTQGKAADSKKVGDEISSIEADLGDLDTKIDAKIGDTGWQKIVFTPDSFIDLSKTTADVSQMTTPGFGFSCAVVPCSAGDKFLLNLTGGGRSRAWGFVSSNGNVVSVAEANTTVSDYTLIAPANSAYLVLHDNSGSESYIIGETVMEFINDKTGIFDWNRRCFIILNVDPVDLTPVVNSGINHMIINCKAGDKFVVSGSGGNQSRLWGFVDSNNHILAVADANAVADGLEIIAPENATKLIVNNQYSLADGVVLRVGSLACKVANLETPEIVKTAEFKISGCGLDQDPNDGKKWKFKFSTATNRAVTKKPISIAKGVFRAKSGYEIAVHQLTSNNRDSFGYTDVLWPEYSRFNWSTDFSIYPGCKYAFLHIRKTDNSDFTENEIKTLWEDAITVEYAEKDGKVNKNNGVLMTEKAGCASQITIAANNSTEHDKEIADYVCCGVNDENVLQAAINYFGDNSGIIQLCNGMYNIDKFKRIDEYDYGLYIEKKLREIIIRGCNHNHKAKGDSFEGADKCPVIRVGNAAWNGLDSTKESYVIGSNREWVFPYKVLGVEDLTIALPDNTKPVVGIDGMYLADLHVYRCFFRTEGTYTDDVNINPKCIAIRGCPGGQIGYNYSFEHIKIIGWGTGLQFNGEASTIIDVQVQRAAYGFVFGDIDELNPYPRHGGIHPSVMINCGAANCAKSIVVFGTGNRNTIEIIAFNCESGGDNYTIPGKVLWKAEHLFEYRSNGTMMGSVTYAFVDVLGGWRPNPINIWGDDHSADPYFRTTDLRAKTKGTTEERPENPCFMSKYYDTTIGKFIMFNGTSWVEIS